MFYSGRYSEVYYYYGAYGYYGGTRSTTPRCRWGGGVNQSFWDYEYD